MTKKKLTKEAEAPAKLDPKEYNRLVSHARVHAIRLIGAKYDIKPNAFSGNRDDWKYNVSNRLLDWHCDNETLQLTGTWEYTATCQDGRRNVLKVVAKYLVIYRLSGECDPEAARQFYERVARFAAYPYFRGTFATLTQQSGVVLHPLPIISEQPRWVTPPEGKGVARASSPRKRTKKN